MEPSRAAIIGEIWRARAGKYVKHDKLCLGVGLRGGRFEEFIADSVVFLMVSPHFLNETANISVMTQGLTAFPNYTVAHKVGTIFF